METPSTTKDVKRSNSGIIKQATVATNCRNINYLIDKFETYSDPTKTVSVIGDYEKKEMVDLSVTGDYEKKEMVDLDEDDKYTQNELIFDQKFNGNPFDNKRCKKKQFWNN